MRRSWRTAIVAGGALLVAAGSPVAVQASTGSPAAARVAVTPARTAGAISLAGRPAGLSVPGAAQAGSTLTILDGVFCTSTRNCWAVGSRESTSGASVVNQMLHWNGKSWRDTSVFSPAGTKAGAISELFAVRCLDAANCWAVGEDTKDDFGTTLSQAFHWNGKKWSFVHTPNPAGTKANDNNELFDVTCTSSANCWSVGDFGTPDSTTGHEKLLNLVLHWNGKRWSRATTPNPGPSGFGRTSQIDALACGSGTNCWAAGDYGSNFPAQLSKNEILHWNGKKWARSTVTNPTGDDNFFVGATCQSTRDCWVVGSQGNGEPGTLLNEAAHWNGKRWALVHTPSLFLTAMGGEDTLLAVRCAAAASCWAVGFQMASIGQYRDEILHWNGTKWSVVTGPGT